MKVEFSMPADTIGKYVTHPRFLGERVFSEKVNFRVAPGAVVTMNDVSIGTILSAEMEDEDLHVTAEIDDAASKHFSSDRSYSIGFQDRSEFYKREMELAGSIRKANRHSTATGEWFGPAPEPRPAGPECTCPGCVAVRWAWEQANPATDAPQNS